MENIEDHWSVTSAMKLKTLAPWRKAVTNLDSVLKSRDITLPTLVVQSKLWFFPVVMYRCESWAIKRLKSWCFQIVVLEKPLESPLDCKEIKPKGNQPWIFTERTDGKAEAPVLWPPDAQSRLTGKDSSAGKDWRQKEKRSGRGRMVREHHQLSGHVFEETPGDMEDKGAWCAAVHEVGKSWTQLSNWTTRRM